MSNSNIYLDYAAATPVDEQVLEAMWPFFADTFYNPSADYSRARQIRVALESARSRVAHWLGAHGSEIVFTAGGTEANNLAIHGVMRQFPDRNLITTAIEHESVLAPARGYDYQEVGVQTDGRIDINDLRTKINDDTVLISVGYANNEIGTVQPLREVTRLASDIQRERQANSNSLPLYVHTDACQAGNYLDLHVARLGVDLMSLNGGKIYGPKQSGALYVKGGVLLQPLITGGGQERGLRSGTENVAAAVGFSAALDIVQGQRRKESDRLRTLQGQFLDDLREVFSDMIINGSMKHRLPNNVHITLPGIDNERLLIQLDEAGIMAAAGSACSASNDEPSHVLRAIGLDNAAARSSLRFTSGRHTTEDMITGAINILRRII